MFEKYNEKARRALFFARYEASKFRSRVIESEHILLGILREGEETVGEILRRFQVKPEDIRREIEGERVFVERESSTAELPLSEESKKILAYASHEAESMLHPTVGSAHLLIGILRVEGSVAMHILTQHGFDVYTVREEVLSIAKEQEASQQKKERPFLTEYGRDLTSLAAESAFDPLIGRDAEVDRIVQILSRRTKNNPILLGEPGVGKAAIVEGLAQRMIEGRVPIFLANKHIVALDLSLIVAGTNRGQSEERLKGILKELKESEELIVFIDEILSLIGPGSSEGSLDAANILKPALSRGEISCIGATTLKEYRKYIEKDRSLLQLFEPIQIEPPTDEETLEILRRMKDDYQRFHKVIYSDAALRAAVSQSSRYITDRPQPRKAIDVIDEAGALVKLRRVRTDQRRLEQKIRQVVKEMKVAIMDKDFERAVDLRDREIELREDLERMSHLEDEEQVTERDIDDAIAALKGRIAAPEQLPLHVPALTDLQNILVFLSYAREDYEHAVTLYEQLTNRGLRVWMDKKDLLGGMNWQLELRRMIKKADLILICLSKNAVKKRGFIQAEMRLAFEIANEIPRDDIYIVPLRLEASLEDNEIPPDLSQYQYIDMFEERAIDRVLASIDYQLKRRAGKPNPSPENEK